MSARRIATSFALTGLLYAHGASAEEAEEAPREEPGHDCGDHVCFAAKLEGGPSYRAIQGTEIVSGDFHVGLGGRGRNVAGYAVFGGTFGETKFGLPTRSFTIGPSIEAILGRVRIGGAVLFSYLTYTRATSGRAVASAGVAGHFHLTVDVVQIEKHGIYVGVDINGGTMGGAGIAGATGLAGVHF